MRRVCAALFLASAAGSSFSSSMYLLTSEAVLQCWRALLRSAGAFSVRPQRRSGRLAALDIGRDGFKFLVDGLDALFNFCEAFFLRRQLCEPFRGFPQVCNEETLGLQSLRQLRPVAFFFAV